MRINLILVIFFTLNSCAGDQATKYKVEADRLADKEDFYKAEKLYTKAIEENNKFKEAFVGRGNLRMKTKDYKGSIADFSKALLLDSNYAAAWLQRGNVYLQLNEIRKALDDYNKAVSLDAKSEIVYISRGRVYVALKEYQKAVDDYSQAIKLNPKNAEYYLNRARCYELLQRLDLNISDLETIVMLDQSSSISIHNLAFSYSMNKQFVKADSMFLNLYSKNPNDPFLLNNYGFVKFKLGEIKKGKEMITESIKIKPDNSYAYKNMALILIAEKNIAMACNYIDMGIEKGFAKEYGSELEELKQLHCKK